MKRIMLLFCLSQTALGASLATENCAAIAYRICDKTETNVSYLREFEVKDCSRVEVRYYPGDANCARGRMPSRVETSDIGKDWTTSTTTTSYEPGIIMYGTKTTKTRHRWNPGRTALIFELVEVGDLMRTAPLANKYFPYQTELTTTRTYTRETRAVVEDAVIRSRYRGVDTGNRWKETSNRYQYKYHAL